MNIIIMNSSDVSIYKQIEDQIKAQIIQGKLKSGELMPSIRNLAKELQISVITVKKAYDNLEQLKFLTTVGGKGTYVADQDQDFLREKKMNIVENKISDAITEAKELGLSFDEITEICRLIYNEN